MKRYLALYTGEGGPLSGCFDALDLDEAAGYIRSHSVCYYNAAADALGLDPGADPSTALDAGKWTERLTVGEWTLYQRDT